MQESKSDTNKMIIGLVVVALLAIAATVAIVATSGNSPLGFGGSVAKVYHDYKDGSYDAHGEYLTPGGSESIDLKVTLKDNVITGARVIQNAISAEAHEYQGKFASGYTSQVVGKKVDDVSLSRVAGSSLTPIGFNNALDDIKNDARV